MNTDSIKKYSCLITFRVDDKCRLNNLYYVVNHLASNFEFEVVVVEQADSPSIDLELLPASTKYKFVHNNGAFNKSWGINIAANISSGEVLIVHDADMLLDITILQECIAFLDQGIDAVNPYEYLIDLDEDETSLLLTGETELAISRKEHEINRLNRGSHPPFCGGIYIIRREVFYSIGGMDERFRGWGGEDDAMSMRIFNNQTNIKSPQGKVAYHLWHEPQADKNIQFTQQYASNLSLMVAYHESSSNLTEEFKYDIYRNGNLEKYSPAHQKPAPGDVPLVSCLCVTRCRIGPLKTAIDCFRNQSYPNRELLILCDEDDIQTIDYAKTLQDQDIRYYIVEKREAKNLGQLRNLSIQLAKGQYFCQWDDDDWYHPYRISKQLNHARQHGKSASLLTRWVIYSESEGKTYVSNLRIWEGSILCRVDLFDDHEIYDDASRGEEKSMIQQLISKDEFALLDCPNLYVYRHSGNNTWDDAHFSQVIQASTALDQAITFKIQDLFNPAETKTKQFIPKVIHQTAANGELSPQYRALQKNLKDHHPQWQYKFYDNAECRAVIKNEMPELLPCYDGLHRDIQRADLFRLVAVYRFGGFYVDMDINIRKPLDPLIFHGCVFAEEILLSEQRKIELGHDHQRRIANYMFGARPRDPFISRLILQIVHDAPTKKANSDTDVLESTGPGMVTVQYHQYPHKDVITVLPSSRICPKCNANSCTFGEYADHLHEGSWRQDNSKPLNAMDSAQAIKIIHQTWKVSQLPHLFARLADTWKSNHPDWQSCLWTDEDNRNLIKSHYNWFLPIYDQFPYDIQRVDAARYFILYSVGGLYVDLDFRSVRSIDPLIDNTELILGLENPKHSHLHNKERIIGNAFIYAPHPGSQFLRKVIEAMCSPPESTGDSNLDVLESTGPFMLSRVYESYSDKKSIQLLPSSDLYPIDYMQAESLLSNPAEDQKYIQSTDAFAVHYHCGSWWKPEFNQYNDK